MRHIGTGYYYRVYDLGNGRVRKIEKGFWERVAWVFLIEGPRPWNLPRALYNVIFSSRLVTVYDRLLRQTDPALIGNPKLLNGIDYEQDSATMLSELISGAGATQHIDAFIRSIIESWRYGFADHVFNFTLNNGFRSDGRIVLVDFNEITFSKEYVRTDICTKRWLRAASYHWLPQDLKSYYAERMDELLTEKTLDEVWGTRMAATSTLSDPRSPS